jgi:hypothetical protein
MTSHYIHAWPLIQVALFSINLNLFNRRTTGRR